MKSIPPFRLRPEPLSPDAAASPGFRWAPEEVGHRHQLGGQPGWLQGDATPTCPACGEPMTFYGQLDSIDDDVVIADCGLVYVFVCFNDYATASVVQSM